MKTNMHIHSKYSWDCKTEIEDIALELIKNNINYACITDHIEFNMEPLPYVLTKFKIRNLEIDNINDKYKGKLTLLKGAEISSPHLYFDQVSALNELDLDLIMGSIHKIKRNAKTEKEKLETFKKYYQDIQDMINAKQIDVVGHIDYINRYYDKDYSDINQVSELLANIVENKQIIEINSSAKRRNAGLFFPDTGKCLKYSLYGGKEVTVGTDAHYVSELNDNLDNTDILVKELKLEPVILRKRKIEKI